MSTDSHSSGTSASHLLTLKEASERFNLHPQTLRAWSNEKKIKAVRTLGGHRRFCPISISKALGIRIQEKKTVVAIYCRVSSKSQEQKGSLKRQIQRLTEAVKEREGESPVLYDDAASAFGVRKNLNKLIEDVIAGTVRVIYVENFDRWSRVPALTKVLLSICSNRNVSIVALDREEKNPNELQAAMLEMVEFSTSISNRINGARGGRAQAVGIPAEAMEIAYKMRVQGYSIEFITDELIKKGFKNEKGNVIKRTLLRKRLAENYETYAKMFEGDKRPKTSFELFIDKHITKTRSKKKKLRREALIERYRKFCNDNGYIELTHNHVADIIKREKWDWEYGHSRRLFYKGVMLTTKQPKCPEFNKKK